MDMGGIGNMLGLPAKIEAYRGGFDNKSAGVIIGVRDPLDSVGRDAGSAKLFAIQTDCELITNLISEAHL
jgi:hypothetical protein